MHIVPKSHQNAPAFWRSPPALSYGISGGSMDGQKLSFNNFLWWAGFVAIPVLFIAWKITVFISKGNVAGFGFDWVIFAFFAFASAIMPLRNLEIDKTSRKVTFTSRCMIYDKRLEFDISSIASVTMTKSYTRGGKRGRNILVSKVIVFKQTDGTETFIEHMVDEKKGKMIAEFIGLPFVNENPPMPENAEGLPYFNSYSGSVWQKNAKK
jgi:hypothetical protein